MTIDWFITNRCNRYGKCRFCNAPGATFPKDAPLETALHTCDAIIRHEFSAITLCGGEPLFYPGIDRIVMKLSTAGIRTVLYTNGLNNNPLLFDLLPNVSILSLPLDAISPSIAASMRGYDQVLSVRKILSKLSHTQGQPIIKIGTVVTKQNIVELPDLATFVKEVPCIKVWRIYQYSPGGIGASNVHDFSITNIEFNKCVADIVARFTNTECAVSSRSVEDNIGYCMIMDSHGRFYRYDGLYHALPITICDDNKRIAKEYDLEKYQRQKCWHNLTP